MARTSSGVTGGVRARAMGVLAMGALATGCGGGPEAVDAAMREDAGGEPIDTGVGPLDAGPPDGGRDAPFFRPDAGAAGGPIVPLDACDDDVASLYLTPGGLPPFEASVRGALLGCARVDTITAGDLASRLSGVPDLVTSGGDVRVYVIAYRTEREPRGVGGISTALVYLPDAAYGERVPMVLAAHGTIGIADVCAPSRFMREGIEVSGLPASYLDPLLLSYAARGLPVVAPDYAGLGTEGVHGYDSWLDGTRSAIDGVRALRALVPAERLDGGTIVYGHSQGGGISLALAGLASEAPDVDIRAIVAAAPGYRLTPLTSVAAFSGFALDAPFRAFATLAMVSGYANLTEEQTRWGEALRAEARDRVVEVHTSLCIADAITALAAPSGAYVPPTTIGEALDPAFVAAVTACNTGGACDGIVAQWVARDEANEPRTPAGSPPILVLGSSEDEINPPRFVGCVIDRVQRDGADPEICMASLGDHLAMVPASMTYAIDWSLGTASGGTRPVCPGTEVAPRCSLF